MNKKERKLLPYSASFIFVAFIVIAVFLYLYGSLVLKLVIDGLGEGGSFQALLPLIVTTAFVLVDTQIFLMISRFAITKYLEFRGKKRQAKAILMLYTYVVWAFMIIILVTGIFKDVGAILTSLGLIGFGVTFALQKPILNFVGWLTVVITNPFTIGDRIEVSSAGGSVRGDVISIHTMYTRVLATRPNTLERSEKIVTIPNELILTNSVTNYSRRGDIFWDDITVSITYESNWRKAISILEKAAESVSTKYLKNGIPTTDEERKSWHEAALLLKDASKKLKRGFLRETIREQFDIIRAAESKSGMEPPKPHVQMVFADSAISLNVLYITDVRSVRASRDELVRAFMQEIEKRNDIEIAYPHMQVIYNPNEKHKKHGIRTLGNWDEKMSGQAEE